MDALINFTTREACDSAVENCDFTGILKFPEHPPNDLYIFAAVSLVNMILPEIYYNVSKDYLG